MAFDLGELLKDVSKSDTGREQIEYISLDLIDGDAGNFYELSDIESLAGNIATIGLQQPLRVRIHPDDPGRYMVVSGHRRREALLLLAADEPEHWHEIACIVDHDTVSPALQQLRLIFGNANTRKMSSADLSEQAAQVEKLLYQLKEDGYEFPGRMRDHVAQVVQTSKTKLARLKMIRDNLAPCWQPDYKKDVLGESSAYELSKMPEMWQTVLREEKSRTNANIRYLYASDVEKYAGRVSAITHLACDRCGNEACTNQERKVRKAAVTERYSMFYCDKCCADCPNLASCKNACPHLKDKIAQIKADAKEAKRKAQQAEEEVNRPIIEKLQQLWYRFGLARQEAGTSVQDVYKAAEMYYVKSDEDKMFLMESLSTDFTPDTTLPYGYSFRLSDARKLVAMADLLGCSLDYLFCRTDVREMAQVVPQKLAAQADAGSIEIIPGAWYPPSIEPPVGAEIIMVDKWECTSDDKYLGGGLLKDATCMEWKDTVLWTPIPKKATAEKLPEAPTQDCSPMTWRDGQEKPQYHLRALTRFDMHDGYPPVEVTAYWRGQCWEHRDGLAIDGRCLGWFPLPSEVSEANRPLNAQCVTGLNPHGHCGSAAYCSEPYTCCKDCPDPCNSCCGYLEAAHGAD